MKTTVPTVYMSATAAIRAMITLMDQKRGGLVPADVYPFENRMNSLSGELQNLPVDLLTVVQKGNEEVIARGRSAGVVISLHPSVLPSNVSHGTNSTVLQQGKKLYPLTTSVVITANLNTSNTVTTTNVDSLISVGTSTVIYDANVLSSLTESSEEIDSIFDELDAEIVVEENLASIQTETAPYISNALISLAFTAAANVGGLQDGLSTFSYNPLADIINSTRNQILYYTENNYANLNVALSGIQSDVALVAEYKKLRNALGGVDGRTGCVSQLDFFLEHTNRLSGLVLDDDSPNKAIDNDSATEFSQVLDLPSGSAQVLVTLSPVYFRSGRFTIQATANSLDRAHQVNEILVVHDNVLTYNTNIATCNTSNTFVTYTTQLANGVVEILANSTVANTDYVIQVTKLRNSMTSRAYKDLSQQRILEQQQLLEAYLDDGIDYVARMSESLIHSDLVGNLSRLFVDMLATFSGADFLALSTGTKQAQIVALADNIVAHCAEIQSQIDADWNAFVACRRLTEALDIAYNLSVSSSLVANTLNSVTIDATSSSE